MIFDVMPDLVPGIQETPTQEVWIAGTSAAMTS